MTKLLVSILALLTSASLAGAHEIGTTQVRATFDPSGAYTIDVIVDPDALLTRLQILDGRDVAPLVDRIERDRALGRLMPVFLDSVELAVDGVRLRPDATYLPASPLNDLAQSPSEVRLTGMVPGNAAAFTLRYALATGTFALVARIQDSAAQTFWLDGDKPSQPVSLAAPPPPASKADVAARYFGLGFTHILPKGLDHILFVVGLFLLSTRWRSVLTQVSAFTLAHSITLGLTIYGVVSLPARVVEPMIALSIAYVAIENLVTTELKSWRVALVFAFGLLHGMGFAGVLRDLGLPRADFLTALLTFNLGVEAGQLAVVAIAFAGVACWRSNGDAYRRRVVQPASVAVACCGVYWTIARLM
jgi:hydrogenase/urease accessory protein HupE